MNGDRGDALPLLKPRSSKATDCKHNCSIQSTITIALVVFVGDAARGVLFPSLWPRIQSMGGKKLHQGLAVASFSLGRIISSPILGRYSELFGYRQVLVGSTAVFALGCLAYLLAESLGTVFVAQWIIGFGAGTLGVTRSYVIDCTSKDERTVYIAYLTAIQYSAFTMTPLLGACLSSLAADPCLLPVGLLLFVSAVCVTLLLASFEDVPRDETRPALESRLLDDRSDSSCSNMMSRTWMRIRSMTSADATIMGGCLLNIATKGCIGVFETLAVEYGSTHFRWEAYRTGRLVTMCGAVGFLCLLGFSRLLQCVSDVNWVLVGMAVMAAACLLLVPVGPMQPSEEQFLGAVLLMYGIGYPIGHTALIGVFALMMKTGRQGTLMGYFGSAGSLARVVFPILAGVLSDAYDDTAIFLVMAGLLLVAAGIYRSCLDTVIEVIES